MYFLGLMGCYRKFFQNYGKIASPLIALLKKNGFNWTLAADQSFQALKETMCMNHMLEFPDFTNTFVLEWDASRKGIGVVLMQNGRNLDFTTKQLSKRHLVKSTYEKEMLSIIHVMDL